MLIWAAWVAGAKFSMWALIVATGTVVLLRAAYHAVVHLFRVKAAGEEGTAPTSMTAWAVVVDRGLRALVIVGGIWLLSWRWGLDLVEITGRDTHQRGMVVGRDARMRREKSGAPSAACAAWLIRERRRSSANGSVVSTRPDW